jgi:hypothetical protein
MGLVRRLPGGQPGRGLASTCSTAPSGGRLVPRRRLRDPAFADTYDDGLAESEFYNVLASLGALGYQPSPFSWLGYLSEALVGADALLIPEQEVASLAAALTPGDVATIANFVAGGGGLIVQGSASSDASLLNAVFGLGLVNGYPYGTDSALLPQAAGTAFAGGVATLPGYVATWGIVSGQPSSATRIYDAPPGTSTVMLVPHGAGQIAYLGWDWYGAYPRGGQDNGWLSVLGAAVTQVSRGCGDALDLPAEGGVFTGATGGVSTLRYLEAPCPPVSPPQGDLSPERVFRWVPPRTGTAQIETCGSDFDTVLYIRRGTCADTSSPPVPGGCNDQSCGNASVITPSVVGGETYFIVVDGWQGDTGRFQLSVIRPTTTTTPSTTTSSA